MNITFKTTTALLFLFFATITQAQMIPNHKSTVASDEYLFIIFKQNYNSDIIAYNIIGQDWSSIGRFYKTFDGFKDSIYTLGVDEVKYETVFHLNSGTSKSLLEVRDSTNSTPIAFFYSGEVTRGDTILAATDRDKFIELQDSLNVHMNTNHTMPFTNGMQSVGQVAYPISFDEADSYVSGYTPSELAYVVEYNADGYKFELIQDTDRSDLLVGFRYKSGLNSNTYTKFIVPNN
ncbi:hypothetical protein OAQ99_00355 [Candidatus Kapabacteria bacterium]|nr:hypothetical protein [Candidatus Kapabacteria bacterium]